MSKVLHYSSFADSSNKYALKETNKRNWFNVNYSCSHNRVDATSFPGVLRIDRVCPAAAIVLCAMLRLRNVTVHARSHARFAYNGFLKRLSSFQTRYQSGWTITIPTNSGGTRMVAAVQCYSDCVNYKPDLDMHSAELTHVPHKQTHVRSITCVFHINAYVDELYCGNC